MQQGDILKTLDEIARAEGYTAASRTEAVIAAVLHTGIPMEDIEILQRKGTVTIRVVAHHGTTEAYNPGDDYGVETRDNPVVHIRR